MKQYHKIQTVFFRDPQTSYKTLLDGQFAKPEFEYLQHNIWEFTEKVDGTNIRVAWDGTRVFFAGKTDHAEIPAFLSAKLHTLFPLEKFQELELPPLCLYGEGYGAKIQKGHTYIPDNVDFILFDVLIQDYWLERQNVEDIGHKLQIAVVPQIGEGTLWDGIKLIQQGFSSQLRALPPEGLVMRPKYGLVTRRGERIITKLKRKDFSNNHI